jgi:hypothetical protein
MERHARREIIARILVQEKNYLCELARTEIPSPADTLTLPSPSATRVRVKYSFSLGKR